MFALHDRRRRRSNRRSRIRGGCGGDSTEVFVGISIPPLSDGVFREIAMIAIESDSYLSQDFRSPVEDPLMEFDERSVFAGRIPSGLGDRDPIRSCPLAWCSWCCSPSLCGQGWPCHAVTADSAKTVADPNRRDAFLNALADERTRLHVGRVDRNGKPIPPQPGDIPAIDGYRPGGRAMTGR
jgi:hypothetical protein